MARPSKEALFERQIADVISAAIGQVIEVLWADLTAQVQRTGMALKPGALGRLGIPPALTAKPKRTAEKPMAIRAELTKLLRKHDGNISAVAREMGKERLQIRRWITRYQLTRNVYLSSRQRALTSAALPVVTRPPGWRQ